MWGDFQKQIRSLLPSASLSDAFNSVYGGALNVKVPSEFYPHNHHRMLHYFPRWSLKIVRYIDLTNLHDKSINKS